MQNTSVPNKAAAEETALRKDSHLDLALRSQNNETDPRFYYEPMIAAHPNLKDNWETVFGGKKMRFPIWISSMTGGTGKTNEVNRRLAATAKRFGLGMGVGSARIAIEDQAKAKDFNLRNILGDDAPFYLNFGIAQIEDLLNSKGIYKLEDLRKQLGADGFIIHVNPLQEWMQPEGNKIESPPVDTIKKFLEETGGCSLIIKEVGQGFGPESMKALLTLPLTAIEFAAAGGTNFSKVELQRNEAKSRFLNSFIRIGQSADEMVDILNQLTSEMGENRKCNQVIISGGIRNFLDGYYFITKSKLKAIYGQASSFLEYAMQSQEALDEFVQYQTEGLLLAKAYLKIKKI